MIDNQSQLWNFTFVAHLHKSIDLVRSNVNGQMMVRRISPAADFPVLAALCRIRQRNLMEVYDVRPENGVCVSLCEFINGTTLPDRLYDVKTAKQILCQICDGLTALHSRGIVHRDIKPENIMLLSDGTVKMHFKPTYVMTHFKKQTGMTIMSYAIRERARHALDDYITHDVPVCEAALKNGFCHYNHFTKACHKYYGASPTEIKKQKRAASVSTPLVRSA